MSVTQTVKGRIRNKHQTEADWLKSVYVDGDRSKGFLANPFIPLDGELIIYDPDVAHPYKRLKFGDEKTNVDALPFAFYAKNEIDNFEFITFDEVPTADSTSLVTSASVYNALSAKQDILTFDNDPTEGSANPVTSSGLFSKFQAHQEQIDMNAMSATLAMPGSLKWDGVIGDREHIIVGSVDRFNMCFVHVSDEYPALLDPTAAFTVGVVEIGAPQMAYMAEVVIQDDGFIVGDSFVIVPQDNYEADGVVLPKKGVYFMSYHLAPVGLDISFVYCSALSIMGHSFADNRGSDASKYFEKTTGYSCGDTLTWDGNTDGLESVIQSQEGIDFSVGYYRVSSSVLTVDDVANGLTTCIDTGTGEPQTATASAEEAQGLFNEDGLAEIGMFVNIPIDGYTLYDCTFPKAGIYCVALIDHATGVILPMAISLTIPGYNFMIPAPAEVIKTEHLPKALRFGEIETTIESDTITWDGNTDGLTQIEEGMPFYKVSDDILTMNDLLKGLSFIITGADGSRTPVNITPEQVMQYVYEILNTPVICISLTGSENDIICYIVQAAFGSYAPGVYLRWEEGHYISSFTINDYKGFTTTDTKLVKIDKKYLPDDIGGGLPEVTTNDEGALLRVVNGKWAAVVLPNAEEGEF